MLRVIFQNLGMSGAVHLKSILKLSYGSLTYRMTKKITRLIINFRANDELTTQPITVGKSYQSDNMLCYIALKHSVSFYLLKTGPC